MIFALDSSGKSAFVCMLRQGEIIFEKELDQGLTHSETLLPLVEQALQATQTSMHEISAWALTAGPGSFTGLRIGMALVKGLALPGNVPVYPVSTLKALVYGCGLKGRVIAALDARRSEVYWAAFDCGDTIQRCTPDQAGPVAQLEKIVQTSKDMLFFVGDGAELCYNTFSHYANVAPLPNGKSSQIARGAALLALKRLKSECGMAPADIQPVYLRLSQAERERALKSKSET